METTLNRLWEKHKVLTEFKSKLNDRGYSKKDLYAIHVELNLLDEIIELESKEILNDLLKKTYYRLLKSIEKGIECLPNILLYPENWVLNPIEKDREAWISKDALIFETKSGCAVFSKITRNNNGAKYIDNRWQ